MKAIAKITSTKYFIPVILFILCFLLYGNTIPNDYAEDDVLYTTNQFILQGFSAFKDIFDKDFLYGLVKMAYIQQYRPLTMLSFMTEFSIFGRNPHISHFFNVLFFAFTVMVLYFFLQKILKNHNITIIIAATLLFAFHPIHTEVVANIKSRDEILCLLFGLISFYFIILHEEKKEVFVFYFISLLAFFAALFCKESALTFMAIIPLLLYFFTSLKINKIVLKTIPYFVLVGIYLFVRSQVLQSMTFTHPIPISDNSLMSANSNADRMATSFVILGRYIYMTLIPYPLSWDYSYQEIPIESWGNIKPILSLLVCAGLLIFALGGIKKKSIFSFLIAFFFITLSLSCNLIIKIAGTFAERFLYVPSLAFCIAIPVLIFKVKSLELIPIVETNGKSKIFNSNIIAVSCISCLLIVYAIIVIPRNAEWKNNFTLYSSGVITSPNSEKTHFNLAFIFLDSALSSYDHAKSLRYYTFAAQELKKTLAIETYITDTDCYVKLGICFLNEGYQDSAVLEFNKVLGLKPRNSIILNYCGLAYLNKKQYDTALYYFFLSYKRDTTFLIALHNIVATYQYEEKYILALHFDSILLQKVPEHKLILHNISITHNNIGIQYLRKNELDKALEEFTLALDIDPTLEVALKNISLIYEKKGNKDMAEKYARMATEKDPNNRIVPNP